MDNQYFSDQIEELASIQDRRMFLLALFRFAVTGAFATLISACRGSTPTPTPTPTATAVSTPSPTDACLTASRCNDRHYCDADNKCACVQSAEGTLQCGRLPSTCYMPLCSVSTDCQYLGPGYFCDTPNSGCCSDPPAEKARCIPPCVEAQLPTLECQRCLACKEITAGKTPPGKDLVPVSSSDCQASCQVGGDCNLANSDAAFRRLAASLAVQGFQPSSGAHSYSLLDESTPVRRLFAIEFQHPSPGRTAALIRTRESTGKTATFALVLDKGDVSFGLAVGPNGYIEKTIPDRSKFQAYNPLLPAALPAIGELRIVPAVDTASCTIMCGFACSLVLGGIACTIAVSLACPATGPGVLACAVVLGSTCSVLATAGCFAACDKGICQPPPPAKDIWCSCNDTCYSSATACLAECKTSLGCFTGICQPNPDKCKPIGVS